MEVLLQMSVMSFCVYQSYVYLLASCVCVCAKAGVGGPSRVHLPGLEHPGLWPSVISRQTPVLVNECAHCVSV